MGDTILNIDNISKTYSGITVVKDVKFDLRAGEVHALMGENGAGKSTLIKMIDGVVKPDEGFNITLFGEKVSSMTPEKAIKCGISTIHQDISLFPNLTVAENISIGLRDEAIVNRKEIDKEAAEVLKMMEVDLDLEWLVGDIGVGKQQLVAIARAIAFESKIIIMDEPTAALSGNEANKLFEIIKNFKKRDVGIIYISHKIEEVLAISDRITVLRDGMFIACDDTFNFTEDKLVSLMVGREVSNEHMLCEGGISKEVLFEANNFTLSPLFSNISFKLFKKEILCFTGLVGAGRSELFQAITGLMHPKSGEVKLRGKPVRIKQPQQAINLGICYLPEDRHTQGVFKGQEMTKNITVLMLSEQLNKIGLLSKKLEKATTNKYIEQLNIKPNDPDIFIENMSGGNQQKVLIGRYLNSRPTVLIVDEPTFGVDVGAKREIHMLLRSLADAGVGVIVISSDLSEVLTISDRIFVMREGRIAGEFSASEATQEKIIKKGVIG